MSQLESIFSDIANSIRAKTGESSGISPANMSSTINNIQSVTPMVFNEQQNTMQKAFNAPILVEYNAPYLLDNYIIFNSEVTLTENVLNCAYMFKNCFNFNQFVDIDCTGMFYGCNNFNQPVTVRGSSYYMLYNCNNFNSLLTIDTNGFTLYSTLGYSYPNYVSFYGHNNMSFAITNNVTNCNGMFSGCNNFNQPIISFTDAEVNCVNMFSGCYNFNQPIPTIKTIIDGTNMFSGCYNLNQPINILSVKNPQGMFYYCYNLGGPITIGYDEGCTNMNSMFASIHRYSSSITSTPIIVNINPTQGLNLTYAFSSICNHNNIILLCNNLFLNNSSNIAELNTWLFKCNSMIGKSSNNISIFTNSSDLYKILKHSYKNLYNGASYSANYTVATIRGNFFAVNDREITNNYWITWTNYTNYCYNSKFNIRLEFNSELNFNSLSQT